MKQLLHCHCADAWKDKVYAALRVVVGLAFFYHGYVKVFNMGMEGVTGFFTSVGIPAANLFAFLVAYGELLGGIALMLGLLSHWVAKANILIMAGAIFFVHYGVEGGWFNGYGAEGGYEYALLLLVVNVYILTMGSGKYSLDEKLLKKHM